MPQNPVERRVGLFVLVLFLVGLAMAYSEARKWWKTRLERYGEPKVVDSLRSLIESDTLRPVARLLRGVVSSKFHSIRGLFRSAVQKTTPFMQVTEYSMQTTEHNTEKDQSKAA